MDEQRDDLRRRVPWWLRPPAAAALIFLLLLGHRWTGVVVPLAILVLAVSVIVLGLALLSPRFRERWF